MLKIAVDRGGTFTDIYAIYNNEVYTYKLLSSSPFYSDPNTYGIKKILEKIFKKRFFKLPNEVFETVRFGTTVATNALLERKGVDVTLAITQGFKDLLKIGTQQREDLFSLEITKPTPLYKKVIEIKERVIPTKEGFRVLTPLEDIEIEGEGSLAVVCLHSYGFEDHEKRVKPKGFKYVVRSSEVISTIGVLKRAKSSVVDAYLTPVVKEYVQKILREFESEENIYFLKSDGSLTSPKEFRGINSLLSGPAGGVSALKTVYNGEPLIGFDMGGTSTDVSRYDGEVELVYEAKIASEEISYPMVEIHTVASGGGSVLNFENNLFKVGPQSSGSDPGPLCYGRGGKLSISDANLVTGRLQAQFMPKIFGKNGKEPLNLELAKQGFKEIATKLNKSVEEIAEAFLDLANEQMANAIKEITVKKGFDPKTHTLVSFGGAGGQHAVGVARKLGISKIFIPRHSGIFSAVGILNAPKSQTYLKAVEVKLKQFDSTIFNSFPKGKRSLFLKYEGTNTALEIEFKKDLQQEFKRKFKRQFGFLLERELVVESVKVEVREETPLIKPPKLPPKKFSPIATSLLFLDGRWQEAKVYRSVGAKQVIKGPAIILQESSTVVLDDYSKAVVTSYGDLEIFLEPKEEKITIKPAKLSLLANRFQFIATKMGHILQKAAISTNIKERNDFSCAIFDATGDLITNAPHIPVHLGSMSSVVKAIIKKFKTFKKGESFITNAPYEGGSHLPDITVVTPYVEDGEVKFWVASRGHHADIGGSVPGSMPPFSTTLQEEGALIEAFRVVENGVFKELQLRELLKGARRIEENISDIKAQLAANLEGIREVCKVQDREWFFKEIKKVSSKKIEQFFKDLTTKEATDYLDNGAKIALKVYKKQDKIIFDFSNSSPQLLSNQNTPSAVVRSAVIYSLRVMLQEEIPLNDGLLEPIEIILPKNSLLNPKKGLAVVGGNVTTSQRVVDVIFKAFKLAGASQGCMNNVVIGDESFGYYETVAGGAGATRKKEGASGVHTHMTNTKITDVEVIERRYPFMIEKFALRKNSGGEGRFKGGDGVIRIYRFLKPLEVGLLTERRALAPYGMEGGEEGKRGENYLEKDGETFNLGGKAKIKVESGDRLILKTPGGGGWGLK